MTIFVKSTAAALTVVTVAAAATFGGVQTAEAKNGKFWAGVGAGVVAGAIINHHHNKRRYYRPAPPPPRPVYVAPRGNAWDAHVSWCYNRYRSYSHHDNAFTTYSGYRKTCRSPYL